KRSAVPGLSLPALVEIADRERGLLARPRAGTAQRYGKKEEDRGESPPPQAGAGRESIGHPPPPPVPVALTERSPTARTSFRPRPPPGSERTLRDSPADGKSYTTRPGSRSSRRRTMPAPR